jgi:hypothetical protein
VLDDTQRTLEVCKIATKRSNCVAFQYFRGAQRSSNILIPLLEQDITYKDHLPRRLLQNNNEVKQYLQETRKQLELIDRAAKVGDRINNLPTLRDSVGPTLTLWKLCTQAIANAGGESQGINWKAVQDEAIRVSLHINNQPSKNVMDAIHQHSPGCITKSDKDAFESQLAGIKRANRGAAEFDAFLARITTHTGPQ